MQTVPSDKRKPDRRSVTPENCDENKEYILMNKRLLSLLLALANLPRTVLLGFLSTVALLLCVRFVFPLFFLPALTTLLSTLAVEPMFRPFLNIENTES